MKKYFDRWISSFFYGASLLVLIPATQALADRPDLQGITYGDLMDVMIESNFLIIPPGQPLTLNQQGQLVSPEWPGQEIVGFDMSCGRQPDLMDSMFGQMAWFLDSDSDEFRGAARELCQQATNAYNQIVGPDYVYVGFQELSDGLKLAAVVDYDLAWEVYGPILRISFK